MADPANPAFVFNTYPGDFCLALRLIRLIRQHYPSAEIVACPDGRSAEFEALSPGCYIQPRSTPLKRPDKVHLHSFQTLQAALEHTSADLLIQIDPDAYLSQPFKAIPDAQWFGQTFQFPWQDGYTGKTMHGACWGMRRTLLERLVSENPFTLDLYTHPQNLRANGSAVEDRGFSMAVAKLLPPSQWGHWTELHLRSNKVNCTIRRGKIAAVHPNRVKGLPNPRSLDSRLSRL